MPTQSSEEVRTVILLDLPSEILQKILVYAAHSDLKSLGKMAQTCKKAQKNADYVLRILHTEAAELQDVKALYAILDGYGKTHPVYLNCLKKAYNKMREITNNLVIKNDSSKYYNTPRNTDTMWEIIDPPEPVHPYIASDIQPPYIALSIPCWRYKKDAPKISDKDPHTEIFRKSLKSSDNKLLTAQDMISNTIEMLEGCERKPLFKRVLYQILLSQAIILLGDPEKLQINHGRCPKNLMSANATDKGGKYEATAQKDKSETGIPIYIPVECVLFKKVEVKYEKIEYSHLTNEDYDDLTNFVDPSVLDALDKEYQKEQEKNAVKTEGRWSAPERVINSQKNAAQAICNDM